MSGLVLKPYRVAVQWHDPATYYAASPGKAQAAAWRQYTGAGFECSYGQFLSRSRVRRCEAGPGFGEKITVAGEPAFRVPVNHGHYVGFVRHGSDQILLSHPRDVNG